MVLNGWTKIKNPEIGITAVNTFILKNTGTELHLIGPDFGPGQIAEQWCGSLPSYPSIHFHGSLPHKATMQLMTTMDVLLHPSVEESFGLTVAEAMSMGIPVICGRSTGALAWMTDYGNAGILTDVTSPDEIVLALNSLHSDNNRYQDISIKGRRLAKQRFSSSAISDQYIATYKSILSKSSSSEISRISP